ncbi:hypothetical protein COV18_02455 [Candidatus Woesearchaeota archaeon CG10_big_fil_rev_8_21_14_0_10_37_12]|nr:MAG: hypothetical protein COV18_02455 [Candidatus Woesearchaeota archaeon CG10_big_fil_rev_8_21_14_0_10_37_12]
MSYVNIILVKDDRFYFASVHYRTAMKLMQKGPESVLPLLKHRFLDAGYLVFDLNKKSIVSNQCAFPAGIIAGKNWFVVEV